MLTAAATVENSILYAPTAENFSTPWSNVNLQLTLFQKPQILRTISSEHDIIHTQAISYLGFIMTIVIVISFTRERKTVPNGYAPELRAE